MGFLSSLNNAATASSINNKEDNPVLVFTSGVTETMPSSVKKAFNAGYKLKTVVYDQNLRKLCWILILPEYAT